MHSVPTIDFIMYGIVKDYRICLYIIHLGLSKVDIWFRNMVYALVRFSHDKNKTGYSI